MSLVYHNQTLQSINNNIDDRLYELLLEKMNTNEQQLFVQNFKIYLLYGEDDTAFVINLDDIWEWVGFSRKDNAKTLLIKKFTENINYMYYKDVRLMQKPYSNSNGNKETILLTVNTFKKYCMKASTKRADEICDYYLKMERIMHQYTKEKITEMQVSYENTKNELSKYIENSKVTDDNIFWNDNSLSDYDNKNVIYIGYIGIINNERLYKFGKSEQVYTREFTQHKKFFNIFKMKHIEVCDNMSFVEKEFKKELKTKNLLRTIEINSKNLTELFTVTDQVTVDKIIKNLNDLIIKYPHMYVKEYKDECEKIKNNFEYEKIEMENEYLKKENEFLKKEVEYIKKENSKITELYDESKQEYKDLKVKYKNKKKELLNYVASVSKNVEELQKENTIIIENNNATVESIENEIIQNNEINKEIINNDDKFENEETFDNEEMCETSDMFCDKYIQAGEDVLEDLPEKRFRVQTSKLFDLYNQKCLNPLSRPKFNTYLSDKYNIVRKNCAWTFYENKQTWCGIKLKNTKVEEKKIDILMKSFIETYCECGENLYVKTKRFHDIFKDYCNNNDYDALAVNGWSQKKCRIALEKLNFRHEIIGTSKSLYRGIMLKKNI